MFARALCTPIYTKALRPQTIISQCIRLNTLVVASGVRGYAHSRFPARGPGASRIRARNDPSPSPSRRPTPEEQGYEFEQQPSAEESPLWQASQRPPSSNPEEGLKKLLLENDVLVVTRQIEMLNIFAGFEQSNKYVISNPEGETLGYIAEEPRGILSMFARQIFRTHRPFRAVVMDTDGSPVLWLRRPFAFINSRMFVQRLKDFDTYTAEGEPVLDTFGEAQQRWHIWRRRYELYLRDSPHRRILSLASEKQPEPEPEVLFQQLANIDEGLLAWDFTLRDARGDEFASVNRTFRGFGREIFTDTGMYNVRFTPVPPDPADPSPRTPSIIRSLNLEERAVVLAMAVNIDFDYFSRHSGGGGWGLPLFLFASTE